MMTFTESTERSDILIGVVMFLSAFVLSLFSFYLRMIMPLYLAIILFAFCWVGNENVHKAFRLIPIVLCLVITAMAMRQSSIYGINYYYYDFISVISGLTTMFLIVSLLPDKLKHRRAKS